MEEQKSAENRTELSTNQGMAVLIATSLAFFFTSFMTSGLNVALPFINRVFGADAILLSWVITSYLLVIGVFLLPFGRIADIIGIKKIFLWGMIIYAVTCTAATFSNSIIMLITCRSIQGIGCAMVFSTGSAMVTALYPTDGRGRALGTVTASVYFGYSGGPLLGGLLTEHFGWRSMFLVNVPAAIVVILIILLKVIGEQSESKGEKFDINGSIVYGLALIALIYGFSLLPEIFGALLSLAGIMGILAFLKLQSRTKSPVLDIGIFRHNKALLFSNIATLIMYCSTFAVVFLMSLYLQYIKALSPKQAGLILVAQPAMLALLSPFTGRLSDKIEPRIVSSVGMALTFVGLLLFSFLTANNSIVQIIIILLVIGLGLAFFVPPNTNAVMSSVTPKFYGIASAANGTMRTIGQILSMGITTIVMAIIIGRVVITPEYYAAFVTSAKYAFAIFGALCFGGIFTSLSRGKVR